MAPLLFYGKRKRYALKYFIFCSLEWDFFFNTKDPPV